MLDEQDDEDIDIPNDDSVEDCWFSLATFTFFACNHNLTFLTDSAKFLKLCKSLWSIYLTFVFCVVLFSSLMLLHVPPEKEKELAWSNLK
jgi:hypothetical protein